MFRRKAVNLSDIHSQTVVILGWSVIHSQWAPSDAVSESVSESVSHSVSQSASQSVKSVSLNEVSQTQSNRSRPNELQMTLVLFIVSESVCQLVSHSVIQSVIVGQSASKSIHFLSTPQPVNVTYLKCSHAWGHLNHHIDSVAILGLHKCRMKLDFVESEYTTQRIPL